MTLLLQLRDEAMTVRRGVTTVNEGPWAAALVLATATSAADEAPRDKPAARLRWASDWLAPPGSSLSLGDRVSVRGDTYELTTPPRQLRDARRQVGWEAEVFAFAQLYPLRVIVLDQSGAQLAANMPFAVWGGGDTHDKLGTYENQEGEAPKEYAPALTTPNAIVVLGAQRLRVVEAVEDKVVPRVRVSLRRPGG